MKKFFIFLCSVILAITNVNLSANPYMNGENEQQSFSTTHFKNELCNFKFLLWDNSGIGWAPIEGIEITVDGVDYGFVNLSWGSSYAEEIVPLPSGEVKLFWTGIFSPSFYFEVYNSSNELIYTSPDDLPGGLFFTYQNECIECVPITDFEGVYIQEEKQVNLSWKAPESADLTGADVYRNDSLIVHLPPSTISYSDDTSELANGDYTYCIIPVYPVECDLEDVCVEIPINVGVKNYTDNIMIYPNPATHSITISGDIVSEVKMSNDIGQLILSEYNTNEINVSKLTNGIYILSIETSTGQIIQKKIIIKK
jgi:hypothetical protein